TVPIMIVGALAAGSLVPRLGRSNGNAPNPAARNAASVPSSTVTRGDDAEDGIDPTLSLLADYFGVDISTSGLKRQVRQAARNVDDVSETAKATRKKDVAVLRAFFCLGLRWDAPGVSKLSKNRNMKWPSPRAGTLPPDCEYRWSETDRKTLVADIE